MAGQAHYTSAPPAAAGGQGGFRFTSVSPGARSALETLRPLLAYAPPPGAAPRPGPAELAAFPVAFSYDLPQADTPVLTLSRYLGQDYTGRWGNYFGQAVQAAASELIGLRPVELWDAPLWSRAPAPELPDLDDPGDLDDLDEIAPGTAVGARRVQRLLRGTGRRGELLLTHLLTAVLDALASDSAAPVTLVAADTETVVDWLAAVSFALPPTLVPRLTFTTYSHRPLEEHRHVVGTVPAVWAGPAGGRGSAFLLDRLKPEGGYAGRQQPCRAACVLARAWMREDLELVDAVADLWSAATAEQGDVARLRTVCTLVALCTDGAEGNPVTAEERRALEALLDGLAARNTLLPDPVQQALAAGPAGIDAPLATRLVAVAPAYREIARAVLAESLRSDPGAGPEATSQLERFVQAVVRMRPDAVELAPESVRDAAARQLVARPSPFGEAVEQLVRPGAAPAGLTDAYRRAILSGVLQALEASEALRACALTEPVCALLLRCPPDVLGGGDPWVAVPHACLQVARLGAGRSPADRRTAALRVLQLYRKGLLDEDETYDTVRELALPAPSMDDEDEAAGGRGGLSLPWRWGRPAARGAQ